MSDHSLLLRLLFRRFAVPTTSTAVLTTTPATCRREHARRKIMMSSSTSFRRVKWYGPSWETQTRPYRATTVWSFTAPSATHAVRSQLQSGPAAPHPGYVHTSVSISIDTILYTFSWGKLWFNKCHLSFTFYSKCEYFRRIWEKRPSAV